jgi:hypothetical protein
MILAPTLSTRHRCIISYCITHHNHSAPLTLNFPLNPWLSLACNGIWIVVDVPLNLNRNDEICVAYHGCTSGSVIRKAVERT